MIPKKIHYCWFGKNDKSKVFYRCLASWKKFCPDFEIIEWNENNTKQFENKFYKNALRKKKYAFVADYVRSKVLYEFGGIYFDTDMLLLKPIEELLKYHFFSGIEDDHLGRVAYGFFGGEKKHRFFSKMMNFYNNLEFDEFNPPIITHTFKKDINSKTILEREKLFLKKEFYPLSFKDKNKPIENFILKDTIAVHLWDHSWKLPEKQDISKALKKLYVVILDFLFYDYSFLYLKKHTKEALLSIYRILKYNKS